MLFAALLAVGAHAADADPFEPATSLSLGAGTLQGEAPVLGSGGFTGGLFTHVAEGLAIYAWDDGREAPILDQVVATDVYGGWTVEDKVRIDVLLPIYPYVQTYAWPTDASQGTDRAGAAFGDIRLQALIPLAGDFRTPFAFAVAPRIGLPTGMSSAYLGGGISFEPVAIVGGSVADEKLSWLGNVALNLQPASEIENVSTGSSFRSLVGLAWRFDDTFRVGGETDLVAGFPKGAGYADITSTGHLFAQANLDNGLGMTIGGGTGFIAGVGSPDYRVLAAITYGQLHLDKDKDGILDDDDGCPLDPEDFDGFEDVDGCPEPDNDRDTILDHDDKCPMDPEDMDTYEDVDGCPDPDNDGDKILDKEDACPMLAGIAEFHGCPDTDRDGLQDSEDACPTQPGPRETRGCPDRDKDLVPDARDKCPDEPKPADEDPAYSDGCPKRVYITSRQIKITEKVFFQTGKSIIKPESFGLLDEVAKAFLDHPNIEKVEVAGHTDSTGSAKVNERLSQARAQAVADYLTKKGVAPTRLTSKGYGPSAPIDTNRTDVGRQNNRRVEFNILAQTPQAALITPPPMPSAKAAMPTPSTAAAPWSTVPGKLTVKVTGPSWADVYVDDKKLAKTAPFTDVEVPAGAHTITVVNPGKGFTWEEKVTVVSGQTTVIDAGAPKGTSAPWGTTTPTESKPAPKSNDDDDAAPWDLPGVPHK